MKIFLSSICFIVFLVSFNRMDSFSGHTSRKVSYVSSELLQVVTGFAAELCAGIIFADVAIFVGNRNTSLAHMNSIDKVEQGLRVTAKMSPQLIDTYFLAEAVLPFVSKEYAQKTNEILDIGILALPGNFILPFFKGVNLFYHMKEPLLAANVFDSMASKPDAPAIFGHLSAVLSAEGGEWKGAIASLQIMVQLEQDEATKQMYNNEIFALEGAILLQAAVDEYIKDNSRAPAELGVLVPDYIDMVPEDERTFYFKYDPPQVKLVRPTLNNRNPR